MNLRKGSSGIRGSFFTDPTDSWRLDFFQFRTELPRGVATQFLNTRELSANMTLPTSMARSACGCRTKLQKNLGGTVRLCLRIEGSGFR
jgi:hypothetical protein